MTTCYRCGTENPPAVAICRRCGAALELNAESRTFGIAYVLNRLPDLVASGAVDTATAERIRTRLRGEIEAAGSSSAIALEERIVTASAAPAAAPAVPARNVDAIFAEQAPSLLLYVGAFLIVVSALIFVSVSGEQISDALKLALMAAGTLGFLGGGIALHRFPRVLPAGRTFLVIGALLVPIDVAATYALFLRTSPFDSPMLWLAGSLLGAALYATLALTGFGPWYARLFFAANVSAVGALLATVDVPSAWQASAFAALALAHAVVALRVTGGPLAALSVPLLLPAQLLMSLAVAYGVSVVTLMALLGDYARGEGDAFARLGITAGALLATAHYALHFRHEIARAAALVGAGLFVISLCFVATAAVGVYALVLLGLAALYAFAGRLVPGDLVPTIVPASMWREARRVGYLWAATAAALTPMYQAPATGAAVYLGIAAILATIVWTSPPPPPVSVAAAPAARSTLRPHEPLVYVAALALDAGTRYALLALSFTPSAIRTSLLERAELGWAIAAFIPSLVLAAATVAVARYRPHLRDTLAVATLASMAAVTLLALSDHAYRTAFATSYAAVLGAGAIRTREPRVLWGAGAFAGAAALAVLEWRSVPREIWPVALSTSAITLYAVGLAGRVSLGALGAALREVGCAAAALAAATGLWFSFFGAAGAYVGPARSISDPLWHTTAASLLVVAALLIAEWRMRGAFELVVAASASALAAALMEIAWLRPGDAQAYTVPTGAYLIALGLLALRDGRARWIEWAPRLEVVGAIVLIGPTHLASWDRTGFAHGLRLLAEVGVLLAIGLVLRRRWLVAAALAFTGLQALRVLVTVIDRLPNWVVFASSGALLLAVGFVLLLKRELWIRWQTRAAAWWRGWGPADGEAPTAETGRRT